MTAVGFTGRRTTPTPEQLVQLARELQKYRGARFSHGDCCGGDEAAHFMAMDLHYVVHVWPPRINTHRAFTTGHFIHAPQDYAVRNQSIVMMSDLLIALPPGPEADWPRSGTWQTVRKARRKGIPITIIYDDGTVTEELARPADLTEVTIELTEAGE